MVISRLSPGLTLHYIHYGSAATGGKVKKICGSGAGDDKVWLDSCSALLCGPIITLTCAVPALVGHRHRQHRLPLSWLNSLTTSPPNPPSNYIIYIYSNYSISMVKRLNGLSRNLLDLVRFKDRDLVGKLRFYCS